MTRDIFDSITFIVDKHSCSLRFQEISNPGADVRENRTKRTTLTVMLDLIQCLYKFNQGCPFCSSLMRDHPLYEVVFEVDGRRASDWGEKEPSRFDYKSIRQIVKETIATLNNWCKLHPDSFVYFWDTDFSARLFQIYRRIGFICDGRLENYVTYIDAHGVRSVFDGMLNSLPEECWQCTDLWRFVGSRYYKGDRETPVDIFKALLSEIELKQRSGAREMWN